MQKKKKLKSIYLRNMIGMLLIPLLGISVFIMVSLFSNLWKEKQAEINTHTELLAKQLEQVIDKYKTVVEIASLDVMLKTLDYTVIEPYLEELITQSGSEIWSHFIVCNQYGTEQAHSEGKEGHGFSIRTEECFKIPFETGQTYVGQPTVSKSTGRSVLGIGTPIKRDGKIVGVLIGYVWLEHVTDVMNDYNLTENSYTFLLNADGTLSGHPNKERILKENWKEPIFNNLAVSEMLEGKMGFRVVREEEELVSYAYQTVGEYNLNIGVVTPLRESLHLIIELFTMLTVALLVMYLLVILCSLIIVKSGIKTVINRA